MGLGRWSGSGSWKLIKKEFHHRELRGHRDGNESCAFQCVGSGNRRKICELVVGETAGLILLRFAETKSLYREERDSQENNVPTGYLFERVA